MSKVDRNMNLTPFQVFILVVLPSFHPVAYMTFDLVFEVSGADAWLTVIATGLLAALSVFVILSLAKQFPNDTIFTFSKKIFGKYIGTLINLMYILFSVLSTAFVLRVFLSIIFNIAFRETPMIALILLYLLSAVHISTKNVMVISRVAEISFIFLIIILVTIPLLKFEINLDFLKPIGINGIGNISKGVLPSLNSFLGLYGILLFIPYIKNKSASMKSALLGIGFTTIVYTFYSILLVSFFGPNRVSIFFWPILKYIGTISTPVIERVDVILIMLWSAIGLISVYIGFYFAKIGLVETFGLKGDKKNYIIITIVYIILTFLTQYPNDYFDLLAFNKILVVFSLGINFILPLVLLIFSLVFKRREMV